jgi:hypothetical protein
MNWRPSAVRAEGRGQDQEQGLFESDRTERVAIRRPVFAAVAPPRANRRVESWACGQERDRVEEDGHGHEPRSPEAGRIPGNPPSMLLALSRPATLS